MVDALRKHPVAKTGSGVRALYIGSFLKTLRPSLTLGHPLTWLLAILGLTAVMFSALLLIPPHALVPSDGWQAHGVFREEGQFPSRKTDLRLVAWRAREMQLWGSWVDGGPHVGRLITASFAAPATLSFYYTGHPRNPGQHLQLVHEASGERFPINVNKHYLRWTRARVHPPESWVGQPVRLEAVDNSPATDCWIGISTPFADDWRFHLGSLLVIPMFLASLWLLLIPGLWLASMLFDKGWIDDPIVLVTGFLSAFLLCYLVFWVYFLNHHAGRIVSILLMAASMFLCLRPPDLQRITRALTLPDVKRPLLLVAVCGLFYLLLLYAVDLPNALGHRPNIRYLNWALPGDNILSYRLANIFYFDYPRQPFYLHWLSSDRPPLQAAAYLFQRPLSHLWGDSAMHYQTVATLCQLSWIAAVWCLGRYMRLSRHALCGVLGLCIFSGFFTLNSIFTWPKLMAASCVVAAYGFWFGDRHMDRTFRSQRTLLGGLAAMLGLLSHGGVFFTLAAMALILLWPRYFPGWRNCLLGLAAALVLYAPWWAYQHFVDPPGNQLLKWHLASQSQPDPRGVWETMRSRYATLTMEKFWHNKKENLKCLLGGKGLSKPALDKKSINQRKLRGFNHTLRALGVLNAGWLAWSIGGLFFRRSRSPDLRKTWQHTDLMLAMVLISTLIWILLMFKPYSTKIHQGSYASMIFLYVGLAACLCRFAWIAIPLWGLNLFYFYIDWIAPIPPKGILIPHMAVAAGLAGLIMVGLLLWPPKKHPQSQPPP